MFNLFFCVNYKFFIIGGVVFLYIVIVLFNVLLNIFIVWIVMFVLLLLD